MSSREVIVVLGAAGAGKSTFINDVTKRAASNVSALRSVDGTSRVEGPFTSSNELTLFDTVGLNSKNHVSSIRDLSVKLGKVHESQISIVLVCRKGEARWTTWLTTFNEVVSQLIEGSPKVIVYWVGAEALTDELKAEMDHIMRSSKITVTHHLDDAQRGHSSFPNDVKAKVATSKNNLIQVDRSPTPEHRNRATTTQHCAAPSTSSPAKPRQSMLETFVERLELTQAYSNSGREHLTNALTHAENSVEDIHNGRILLRFVVMVVAATEQIADIEHVLAHATSTDTLYDVYKELAPSNIDNSKSPHHYCNIIFATAWKLYNTANKAAKRAFCYLCSQLKGKMDEGEVLLTIELDGGLFEQCVNNASARSESDGNSARILRIVNDVVHKHTRTSHAQLAGSSMHHLDVEGCSDIDIYVHCNEVIDEDERQFISNSILQKLQAQIGKGVTMSYGRRATTYKWGSILCDVVFSRASWYVDQCPAPEKGEYYNNPRLQRAVRALKILHKEDPINFPRVGGRHIAKFVSEIADRNSSSISTDQSGGDLFIQCLKELRIHSDARNHHLGEWQQGVKVLLANRLPLMTALLNTMGVTFTV